MIHSRPITVSLAANCYDNNYYLETINWYLIRPNYHVLWYCDTVAVMPLPILFHYRELSLLGDESRKNVSHQPYVIIQLLKWLAILGNACLMYTALSISPQCQNIDHVVSLQDKSVLHYTKNFMQIERWVWTLWYGLLPTPDIPCTVYMHP